MNGRGAGEGAMNGARTDTGAGLADDLGEVVGELGEAHRDLARLMRGAPLASARRVEHGFTGALRGALDGEFRGVFDALEWDAPDEAAEAADALAPIVADLLLGATLEAARNAGRHGRGGDLSRRLALRVRLAIDADWVTVEVADDGVGFGQAGASIPGAPSPAPEQSGEFARLREQSETGGARSGLLTHGALMALVGGSLAVRGGAGGGAVVTIRAPRSAAG
jgi:histidine kinase/DNA gyrase B/HSP90-like ATPase